MRKKNVLIIGATGLIGHKLLDYFGNSNKYQVRGTTRQYDPAKTFLPDNLQRLLINNIDINNFDSIIYAFAEAKPDIVLNCAGITKQLIDSNGPMQAIAVNSLFPHKLASLATINNARVIHFTTDCVFNGDRGNYTEQNPSDAEDMYGKSKNLGELCYPNCLTLRTSFIGHELGTSHGLIEWFMAQKESAKGYSKAIYSGVPTIELAHILDKYVIENDKLSGLYHLSALPISKLDLITLVAKEYDKKINIIADDKVIIDRSLNSDRFQQMTGYTPKSWSELVNAMFEDYQRCNYYGKYN